MRKIQLMFTFIVLLICFVGCTEDDVVESAQNQKMYVNGGEEGDQELDSERD